MSTGNSLNSQKWKALTKEYTGRYYFHTKPEMLRERAPIADGVTKLQTNPEVYQFIYYQSNMVHWPRSQQNYTLVKRSSSGFGVEEVADGGFTCIEMVYQVLDPDFQLVKDKHTDSMTYQGRYVGQNGILPGRGQGNFDLPGLTLIDSAGANDVHQGVVGDCWLLSAMSAMAEFEGAIRRLFRNTCCADEMPRDDSNTYTVTLFDLPSWTPVDVKVDERLCSLNGQGKKLLGVGPSKDAELWTCYLEKAVAAHCGGWDRIDGGQPTHGWSLLTGCRDTYTFYDKDGDGYWQCYGKFNINEERWEDLDNSPHGNNVLWPSKWPVVGGGGGYQDQVHQRSMFSRLVAWSKSNFVMVCATDSGNGRKDRDGIFYKHAYTILQCEENVAGTSFDLIKIRNPWGKGEVHPAAAKWDDQSYYWQLFPKITKKLQPNFDPNDGTFWLERDEFFRYFPTIYLAAIDMKEFAAGYV